MSAWSQTTTLHSCRLPSRANAAVSSLHSSPPPLPPEVDGADTTTTYHRNHGPPRMDDSRAASAFHSIKVPQYILSRPSSAQCTKYLAQRLAAHKEKQGRNEEVDTG
ncbi:hypothetical protein D9615_010653 [Tricholomella constricta]|uniref:Uncharacterized protein n=1 Tax=Tricholomella constricta TaxID=117010 RepID=A0A8H5GJD2_9AGAR|nr:hypothetical protein D9615_010653 [Tricholomella constricta]